jgi:RHS repeat-associated protein
MKERVQSLRQLAICAISTLALLIPALVSAQEVQFYHLDAIGNVRVVTNQAGQVVERHDYLPFGEECTTGPCAADTPAGSGQPKHFTGKERDTETGLDYFGARYYRGNLGRFTTVDPAMNATLGLYDPQRWNRYAYGRNNPFRYVDPDGKDSIDLAIGFGKGVGGVAAGVLAAPFAFAADPVGTVKGAASGIADSASALSFAAQNPGYLLETYVQLSTSANGADQQALGSAFGQGTAVAALTLAPAAKGAPMGAVTDTPASTPVGRLGSPLEVTPGTNAPTTIGGRAYTGHALDRMQGRGLTPSVVEDTIATGGKTPGRGGATVHTTEQARVITNPNGSVKTLYPQ